MREKKRSQPTEKAQSLQNRSAKGAVLPRCGDSQEEGGGGTPAPGHEEGRPGDFTKLF